ncbi:LLM class flavin-dependent oxidoreductase [Natronomonas amylolytica]|uniref:LLM class flavin-dependent oxidoreductase n=1 Tax=Natronomonas amylolytica TaxID=3108498 RepID=UPI003008BAF0
MPTDLLLPMVSEMDDGDLAARAEDLGYDGLWLGELWGASSVVRLTEIATRTDDIDLGTAILNVFSRTPAVLAMTAASLDDVAGGQFKLGVGTSTKKSIEDLHGAEWDDPNPVRRAHETIEVTKAYLDGDERVEYDGEVFEVQDFPALGADVPVYHAALGKANRRVVARLCDGWIPHNIPFPVLQDNYEYIREHAEKVGRETTIDVVPYVPAAVADDTETARDVIRGHVAYYVGSGEGYERAVAELFPEEAEAVATAWRSGDRSAATEAVTDEMVDALGVAGTPDEARDELRDIADIDCVTRPMVTIPSNADEETARRTIEELAPSNH